MKTLKFYFMLVGLALTTLTFNSCLNDDQNYSLDKMWMSIATARPVDGNAFYLTLDDSSTLWPAAPLYIYYQPDKPQRVQINYTVLGDNFQGYDYAVKLNRIDTILTKQPAENLGEGNDAAYGNDPVEIADIWIGDGFLNILFKANFSGNIKHLVNLIPDVTASDTPHRMEFRHNAFGDNSSYRHYGIVAFDLSQTPSYDKDKTLTVRVKTFEGMKEYNLGLNTGIKPELNFDKISLDKME
ncbi:MAG: NigD-like protein [Tannerellaceae bacterium]|jgi:hypothetical protein|nr:NigD-like protein [Tannerellaceae bacterium]